MIVHIGGACRTRVARVLKKKFTTPLLAEKFYESNQDESEPRCTPQRATGSAHRSTCASTNSDDGHRGNSPCSPVSSSTSIVIQSIDSLEVVSEKLSRIETDEQLKFLDELFNKCCSSLNLYLPPSFLSYSVKGMLRLQESSRSNFLYGLAKGLGTTRSSGADSAFPTKQVIAGLVEYSINFFNATTVAQVSILIRRYWCTLYVYRTCICGNFHHVKIFANVCHWRKFFCIRNIECICTCTYMYYTTAFTLLRMS